jgi:hypothetical protein
MKFSASFFLLRNFAKFKFSSAGSYCQKQTLITEKMHWAKPRTSLTLFYVTRNVFKLEKGSLQLQNIDNITGL